MLFGRNDVLNTAYFLRLLFDFQYNEKDGPEEIGEGSRKHKGKKARR